ncbi:MAG: methyltransferase domain-containing protein [Acidimicrobiia bacterium]|nr:methyltransferase domain-containing protein [Acidimicrobiia bacterium]
MSLNQPPHDAEAQFRHAASQQRLWPVAEARALEGDASAKLIVDTCERIHQSTLDEADRLSRLSGDLDVSVGADSSGQLHLVTIKCSSRGAAQSMSHKLIADGYVAWQSLEGAAEEVFFRTNPERTFVQLGDVTRTVMMSWPDSPIARSVPGVLRPTARDWNAVTVPRAAWWTYFAIRPFRLVKERLLGSVGEPLPLGPILSTPVDLIDQLLEFADLESDDHLIDLGCGDGRVLVHAVAHFNCRATGVEQDPLLVERARDRVRDADLEHRISVEHGDANTFDLRGATVVFLFIPAEHVAHVAGQIRSRGFAGRIISHEQEFVEHSTKPSHSSVLVGEQSLTVAHRW